MTEQTSGTTTREALKQRLGEIGIPTIERGFSTEPFAEDKIKPMGIWAYSQMPNSDEESLLRNLQAIRTRSQKAIASRTPNTQILNKIGEDKWCYRRSNWKPDQGWTEPQSLLEIVHGLN